MIDLLDPQSQDTPRLAWCLALYPRLSRRARRRLAAMLVAATLVAQPLAGFAERGGDAGRVAGGRFRAPIGQHVPKGPADAHAAANPATNPAVARALRQLGLDAAARPNAPAAVDATPAGSQFQVNSYTTNLQMQQSVAMDDDGDFVVVWVSLGSGGTDTSGFGIQGQRYDASGTPQGSQFQVNTYTTSSQITPSVAMDADGDFVVVWQSAGSGGTDTSGSSIQGQRYVAAGTAIGSQFQINTYTTSAQLVPSVAMDADGDFVVVWVSDGSGGTDTSAYSIQGQRYAAAGTAAGGQFQINTYTTSTQRDPSVAMDADGDFAVVWHSRGSSGADTSAYSIQVQRFVGAGTPSGGEIQVNTYTTSSQSYASVAMDADGDFVVVWQSAGSGGTDTSGASIQGQRYNAIGAAAGVEFQVNTYTTSGQVEPAVAMDADGGFVVVWHSSGSGGTDADGISIQGQSFVAAGTALDGEFQVNTYTTGNQLHPSVAMDADGDFVVTWDSYGSSSTDTSESSIQGQRYLTVNPAPGTPHPPTAADLRSYRAIGLPDRAILVWETASEAATLGFDLLRAASAEGPWTVVNPRLIPAEGGASGRTYVHRDAPGSGTWHYRLEDVGAGGKRGALATVQVRVGPGAEGSAVFVPRTTAGRR